jgi:hypothetical protein
MRWTVARREYVSAVWTVFLYAHPRSAQMSLSEFIVGYIVLILRFKEPAGKIRFIPKWIIPDFTGQNFTFPER